MSVLERTRERADVPALAFHDFSYRYLPGAPLALEAVELVIGRGGLVLLCGDSGSGKSSFLRAVSGLLPHHFGGEAAGEVTICGRDLREHDAGQLAAVCGTLLQDPEAQSVMDTVAAEIAFPLENLGLPENQRALRVAEVSALLGITELLERRTAELSGGELQRVALAAALSTRPSVLVLDEPTSQLDPVAADELIATLKRLATDHGTTVLIAEHRIERALSVADRVLCFDAGRVVVDAAPQQFLVEAAADPRLFHLLPPLAELAARADLDPLPLDARAARELIGERDVGTLVLPACASGERRLQASGLGHHYRGAERAALEDVSFELAAGERVVLMGANGSGKSTLLKLLHGVLKLQHGHVEGAGEVALLLQNPNDYLIHERVADEAPLASLQRFGLETMLERDPRDLSGGERQRLALAIVMQEEPAVLLLDEPTRGMDSARKRALAAELSAISARGTAVLVATHDAEFAARFAERALLLGRGRLLADGTTSELLGGGWHFASSVARLLSGSGALTPEQGAELLRRHTSEGESL